MNFLAGAETATSFCTKTANIWQVVGIILFVFKIVIPLLIIIFGMIDLGKAVVASKDDEVKKAIKSLAMRAVAGVVIFFIPTLIGVIFRLLGGFDGQTNATYSTCERCITSPFGGECKTDADTVWGKSATETEGTSVGE